MSELKIKTLERINQINVVMRDIEIVSEETHCLKKKRNILNNQIKEQHHKTSD